MEPEMLRYIDEHFGALSLRTVSTALHFARYSMMTNFRGQNQLVSRETFVEHWNFPTFSVHGAENGLSHVSTLDRMDGVIPYDPPQYPPPTPVPGGTSFLLASCQYPAGFIDEPVAYRSYGEIVARLEASGGIKPRFAVFAGDQVYVDPTAGLYDPRSHGIKQN